MTKTPTSDEQLQISKLRFRLPFLVFCALVGFFLGIVINISVPLIWTAPMITGPTMQKVFLFLDNATISGIIVVLIGALAAKYIYVTQKRIDRQFNLGERLIQTIKKLSRIQSQINSLVEKQHPIVPLSDTASALTNHLAEFSKELQNIDLVSILYLRGKMTTKLVPLIEEFSDWTKKLEAYTLALSKGVNVTKPEKSTIDTSTLVDEITELMYTKNLL
jgi:hypothetical protein